MEGPIKMENEKDYILKLDENAERRFAVGYVTRSKGEGEESPTIAGVAVVFNQETDMGYYIEKVDANAFSGCDMTDVLFLKNHDENLICGRTTGKPDDLILEIKSDGLHYKSMAKNDCARSVAEDIKLDYIKGSSFGFVVDSNEWQFDVKQPDGSVKDVRTITKFKKLYDVSAVARPAYNQTSVALRSRDLSKPKPLSGNDYKNKFKLEIKQSK